MGFSGLAPPMGFLFRLITTGREGWVIAEIRAGFSPNSGLKSLAVFLPVGFPMLVPAWGPSGISLVLACTNVLGGIGFKFSGLSGFRLCLHVIHVRANNLIGFRVKNH